MYLPTSPSNNLMPMQMANQNSTPIAQQTPQLLTNSVYNPQLVQQQQQQQQKQPQAQQKQIPMNSVSPPVLLMPNQNMTSDHVMNTNLNGNNYQSSSVTLNVSYTAPDLPISPQHQPINRNYQLIILK